MSDGTPPPMPDFPPPPPAPKQPRNWVVIGSAAAVIAAVIGTGVFVVNSRDGGSGSSPAAATTPAAEDTVAAAAEESEPSYTYIDANSFTIELRTTRRQCFGSAGCNVTVEPDLTLLVDSEAIDPDAVYEITYEIRGDEDGPVIETAELSDQTSLNFSPSLVTVPSSSTKVSVKITDVAERGY
ncbi:hypothetical protein [Streptomyces sp. NPDC093591]|uniref:hypothetical protein n=1 Tax=Streptomyces sp. NPDC093591 TaxID=3366044 RepID=UPI0037F3A386